MKFDRNVAKEVFMAEQKNHPPQFGAYILPEEWQIDAMIKFAKDNVLPVFERYYANSNSWVELSKTASRSLHSNQRDFYNDHSLFDYKHNGYGYFKISGYQYRVKL